MQFRIRKVSIMLDLTLPLAIVTIFFPPCLSYYASGLVSILYLLQKCIFLLCLIYFFKYKMYRNMYFIFMMGYVIWALFVTLLNGNSIGTIGEFLNLFSIGVISIFCIKLNPSKYSRLIAIWFTLLLTLNTFLWRDGGMYINANGQMSFVLGTKTSLTEYQLVAFYFISVYFGLLPRNRKWKAILLCLLSFFSVIIWNTRQPITTSIICFVLFVALLICQVREMKIMDKIWKFGFWLINMINIGIIFWNIQLLFSNFITNVLHESADLSLRTSIWQLVIAQITEKPWIGHGLNSNTYFAIGAGVASINQATHNGLLYFWFTTGIIGMVYICLLYFVASIKAGNETFIGRMFHIVMICFATLWIAEQIKGYALFFLCLLGGAYFSKYEKSE